MNQVLVIATHPDDETLGCGGTLLKHLSKGDKVHWLIITKAYGENGFALNDIRRREKEIVLVSDAYHFTSVTKLDLPTTMLDTLPLKDIISKISNVIMNINPNVLYLPFPGDAHSDHAISFLAAQACSKCFHYSSIRRILCYETLSETNYDIDPSCNAFRANVFINISEYIDQKLKIMNLYEFEMGDHPYPRSERSIRALASIRGSESGYESAEAFMLIKEIVP